MILGLAGFTACQTTSFKFRQFFLLVNFVQNFLCKSIAHGETIRIGANGTLGNIVNSGVEQKLSGALLRKAWLYS